MDGWNTTFLFGNPIFRGYVSLPEGTPVFQIFFVGIFFPKKNDIFQLAVFLNLQVGATYRLCCFLGISALIVVGLTKGRALKVRRVGGV